ncbi:MAG: tetratricopeptide repeat protein [Deltaproteobacteria bacterium]|nr:tetratricopeptide repeat protein [Candidatus Zymogenaceae bacterium]
MAADTKKKKRQLAILTMIAVISISTFLYISFKPSEKAKSYEECKNLFDTGDFTGCVTCLDNYIQTNPESQAYLMRGDANEKIKNYEAALNDYTEFLNKNKSSHEVYFKRALVYEKLGRLDEAQNDLNISCMYEYAKACNYELAKKSGGSGGSTVTDETGHSATDWVTAAGDYIKAENYSDAVVALNAALTLDPNQTDAYLFRGLSFSNLGRYDEALADYNKVLTTDPNNLKALNNRGVVYWKLERYDEAMNDYKTILSLNPNDYIVLNNRGVLNFQMENFEAARKDFDRVISLKPDFAPAYLNRGVNFSKMNDTTSAKRDFTKACELQLKLGCTEADKL